MIWLEVRDFDRALARLERILARGYAFPFGIESADLFLPRMSTMLTLDAFIPGTSGQHEIFIELRGDVTLVAHLDKCSGSR